MSVLQTANVWADAEAIPDVLAASLAADCDGRAEAGRVLQGARRIVATGNGASFHAAHAFATAALLTASRAPDVVALPAGIFTGALAWRRGDVLPAFSSSGELRDLVELLDDLPSVVLATLATWASAVTDSALARACTAPPSEVGSALKDQVAE